MKGHIMYFMQSILELAEVFNLHRRQLFLEIQTEFHIIEVNL